MVNEVAFSGLGGSDMGGLPLSSNLIGEPSGSYVT